MDSVTVLLAIVTIGMGLATAHTAGYNKGWHRGFDIAERIADKAEENWLKENRDCE